MEIRNGLVVDAALTQADGYVERGTAPHLLHRRRQQRRTKRRDHRWRQGYDTKDFIPGCGALQVTPRVARDASRWRSAIDERTTRHSAYALSQRVCKRVEEVIGWNKKGGGGAAQRDMDSNPEVTPA